MRHAVQDLLDLGPLRNLIRAYSLVRPIVISSLRNCLSVCAPQTLSLNRALITFRQSLIVVPEPSAVPLNFARMRRCCFC